MKFSLSRDSWLVLGLLTLLILMTVVAAIQHTQAAIMPPLTTLSSKPDGARALQLWLEELDYQINQEPLTSFEPPLATSLIFLLEPLPQITPKEWQVLDAWVEAGGTLILAGENIGTLLALRHYEFELDYSAYRDDSSAYQTPLWLSPPGGPAAVRSYNLTSQRNDFVTHLGDKTGPIILSFEKGRGRVILSATAYPFSNAGLKETGNPALVLNLVSAARRRGSIWFDEWHHGLRADGSQLTGPTEWLRYTPSGRSFLYVAGVIFIVLLLRGRRFGHPTPLPQETSRRAPLEYITAIANLNRRAKHRAAVLRQYHHWLKRGLGQRYRLNPTLPDEEYLAQLGRFNPGIDLVALRSLLARLRQNQVSENELIRLADETAAWLEKK